MRDSEAACIQCGEVVVDPSRGCGFCWGERVEVAVKTLVAAAKPSTGNAALAARVDAIDTLRSLGFTKEQVLRARARALDQDRASEIAAELTETFDRNTGELRPAA